MMLNKWGTLELSGVKVWFELKGIHATTLSAETLLADGYASVNLRLDDRLTRGETYLVVYIEATGPFLAEDVRDIVDREWGADFLAPGRFRDQKEITVLLGLRKNKNPKQDRHFRASTRRSRRRPVNDPG